MALASGTRFGSYILAEPLGVGGMGEVYRAILVQNWLTELERLVPAD